MGSSGELSLGEYRRGIADDVESCPSVYPDAYKPMSAPVVRDVSGFLKSHSVGGCERDLW